jgi:hypothetical protein
MHVQFNRFELEGMAKQAAQSYLDDGADLNDTITKLARDHDLNSHQIDRVTQNANILVNGALVTRARDGGSDPRVTFPLAKSAEIVSRLDADGSKTARLRKHAEVVGLFTMPGQRAPSVIDGVLGKMASDPYANAPRSIDPMELAKSFIVQPQVADKVASCVTSKTLGLACQTLESLEHRALTDHCLSKVAMDQSEQDMRDEIHDQVLSGTSPATVRDVIKEAGLGDQVAGYVDKLVTKVSARIGVREGESAFTNTSLVNKQHPLVCKAASVMDTIGEAVTKRGGLNRLSSAHQAARVHYTRAVREGR